MFLKPFKKLYEFTKTKAGKIVWTIVVIIMVIATLLAPLLPILTAV